MIDLDSVMNITRPLPRVENESKLGRRSASETADRTVAQAVEGNQDQCCINRMRWPNRPGRL